MIDVKIRTLKKQDRIFLGWSSWNNYIEDVKRHLNYMGYNNVHVNKLTKVDVFLFPLFLFKALYCFFYYDAFFLFNGKSLLLPIPLKFYKAFHKIFYKDIVLLKHFKKKIFLVFQGSDIRDLSCDHYKYVQTIKNFFPKQYFRTLHNAIKIVDGCIISTIDLIEEFNPQEHKKVIWLPKLVQKDVLDHTKNVVGKHFSKKVLHATTNRGLKGSNQFVKVFDNLKNFDFIVLEKCSKKQVLEMGKLCFCAIDQIVSGIYGTFAMEMMMCKIPVLGYIRPSIREFAKKRYGCDIPILQISPDNLQKTIEDQLIFISDESNYRDQVEKQMKFLKQFHMLP